MLDNKFSSSNYVQEKKKTYKCHDNFIDLVYYTNKIRRRRLT